MENKDVDDDDDTLNSVPHNRCNFPKTVLESG
jgi:hypothetical protein